MLIWTTLCCVLCAYLYADANNNVVMCFLCWSIDFDVQMFGTTTVMKILLKSPTYNNKNLYTQICACSRCLSNIVFYHAAQLPRVSLSSSWWMIQISRLRLFQPQYLFGCFWKMLQLFASCNGQRARTTSVCQFLCLHFVFWWIIAEQTFSNLGSDYPKPFQNVY